MHLHKLCYIYVPAQIMLFVLLRHTCMIYANKITIFHACLMNQRTSEIHCNLLSYSGKLLN